MAARYGRPGAGGPRFSVSRPARRRRPRGDRPTRRTSMPLRSGVNLPTFGPHAGPDAVLAVAAAAERLGLPAVSVSERLLLPADPAWPNEAGLPEWPVLDPIEALTFAAAHTRRVRLATGVVNALFQPPIVLARRLATLDVLSGGRV